MTDILDDSYESDLTEEEHERLILMSEHAIAPPLSPAAQAVLIGFRAVPDLRDGPSIAGALRAAADQMRYTDQLGLTGFGGYTQAQDQILAIADELEAH